MDTLTVVEDIAESEIWLGPLMGVSDGMREVFRLIRKAAPTEITVLIEGESGSGKELAAQTIHALSQRAQGPLCAVNCGAIAENLIASELFGHERGSFTGATRDHRGYFERASGGTLFLDEIAEMPLDLQSSLLRVLETGRVLRVGGSEEIPIDVRIIAATNRPALEAVRSGRLREDLYYRLRVFPIRMPPLRERGDEILVLARHFLARSNVDHAAGKQLSPATEQALLAYPWPGNVRELKNAIERAALLAETSICPADLGLENPAAVALPGGNGGGDRRAPAPAAGSAMEARAGTSAMEARAGTSAMEARAGTSLREAEKQLILDTLGACGGNKQQAAQQLGVSLKTLYNKLKSYAGNDGDRPDGAAQ